MKKEIEVEIRGNLDESEYARLKDFLDKHGEHKESHEREMLLLRDYPGYTSDFVGRDVDIRLRNTSGFCEIMLKQKSGNAREETSLALQDNDLEKAKKIVKALGCQTANWMHRCKEIYDYNGIEWSLVTCPKNIYYYEAEIAVSDEDEIDDAHAKLEKEAKALDLEVLDDEGMRALIAKLEKEVNKRIDL